MLGVSDVLRILRGLDRLLTLETKHGRAIDNLEMEVEKLAGRLTRLEAREDVVIAEARSAAGVAASQVAMVSVSDIARRIGRLEERAEQTRLPPPR